MYFCARYRQEYPVLRNPDRVDQEYLILDAEGRGRYVGTVLSVRTRSPDWFGEGDIRMTIDGLELPSIWGTGTEDCFLSAWGQKRCSTLHFGTPYLSHMARDLGQMPSCFRWHLRDPIPFRRSLRVCLETMGWLNMDENHEHRRRQYGQRQDDLSSVAFWYQIGPAKEFAPPTTAEDRRLPSLDPIIAWGEESMNQERRGRVRARMIGPASYDDTDRLLAFAPNSEKEGWIEFAFEVERKAPLRLLLVLGCSPDSGIYQASLEGVAIGNPIDLHRPVAEIDDFQLMDFWPDLGKYTLRLQCVGLNRVSGGLEFRVNSVRLRERRLRVEEIGLLKDHDWRARPILVDNKTRLPAAGDR